MKKCADPARVPWNCHTLTDYKWVTEEYGYENTIFLCVTKKTNINSGKKKKSK